MTLQEISEEVFSDIVNIPLHRTREVFSHLFAFGSPISGNKGFHQVGCSLHHLSGRDRFRHKIDAIFEPFAYDSQCFFVRIEDLQSGRSLVQILLGKTESIVFHHLYYRINEILHGFSSPVECIHVLILRTTQGSVCGPIFPALNARLKFMQ